MSPGTEMDNFYIFCMLIKKKISMQPKTLISLCYHSIRKHRHSCPGALTLGSFYNSNRYFGNLKSFNN